MMEFHQPTYCCLCDSEAVAIYYLPHGCAARPDLTVQPLCAQHENKSSPVKGIELLKDLRIGRNDEPLYPRRSPASRRADVIRVMTEHPEYSDRRVALIAVVNRELVSAIRQELVRKSLIPSCHALRRVGADGKTYKRLPKPKAELTQRHFDT